MITPFFAPYSHAAVYRAHRFAKYLPRFGWKPYILTVDKSLLYFIDATLLDDLPKEAEIIRARHAQLSFSGIKSLFNRKHRHIKGPIPYELTADVLSMSKYRILKERVGEFLDKFISLFAPDQYFSWYPFAIRKARQIMQSQHIDAIYSTAPPFTPALIAMNLRKNFKVPWIADFRDPGYLFPEIDYSFPFIAKRMEQGGQRGILKSADYIVTLSEAMRDFFCVKYKDALEHKISSIRTGSDSEVFYQDALYDKRSGKFTIVFVGEFLRFYSLRLFRVLNEIFKSGLFSKDALEVLIIGSVKRNIYLDNTLKKIELGGVVRFIDYLSSRDYFKTLLAADATFLPGHYKYCIPIKLTDYLLARKPIIAHDVGEEVSDILETSGLGLILPEEIEKGVEVMLKLLKREWHPNKVNDTYINQFTAINQTQALADILSKLCQ